MGNDLIGYGGVWEQEGKMMKEDGSSPRQQDG